MQNPYRTLSPPDKFRDIRSVVQGPATGLIVVSLIAIVLGTLALIMDIVLLATDLADQLEKNNEGVISQRTTITIRFVWGLLLLIASSFVLFGAIKMRNLKNFRLAQSAAVVAMIPLLGPCCLVGIPFGIWAFVTLGKSGVQDAFG